VLRHLAEIRKAIVGEIQDAEGPDAIRAALDRLFASFTLKMDEDGEFTVIPKRRMPEGFDLPDDYHEEGASGELKPRRIALDLARKKEPDTDLSR
jgi:hypothetical protein